MSDEPHVPIEDEDPLRPAREPWTVEADGVQPPKPVSSTDPVIGAIRAGGILLVLGGLFVVGTTTTTPCVGSTRSARLEWQRRQAEIERAMADQQAPRAAVAEAEGLRGFSHERTAE